MSSRPPSPKPCFLASVFLVLVLAATVASAQPAAPVSPTPQQVDAVFAEWDSTQTPGCSLGVYRNGRMAYARGYGMANLEYGIANSPRTVFRTGSVSKQFTAMAITLLAESGALSLDDDIHQYFPQMYDYGVPVTLRQMIHHTSGLRDYLTLAELADLGEDYSVPEAVELIARQRELNFPPGEEFLYSNSNYFLLSQVVERVTGKTLHEWAEENLFRPLGMTSTHFHDDHTHVVKNRADGHLPAEGGGYRLSMTILDMVGDGGVFTTVEDLLLWDRNFYGNRLGKGGPALIQTVETVGRLNDGSETGYAFGLRVGEHRGLRTIGHGGAFAGYRAAMERYPEKRLTVAVLCNVGTVEPMRLARQVAELYLADAMKPESETEVEAPPEAEAAPEPTALPEAELAAYAGRYYSDELLSEQVLEVQDGVLRLRRRAGAIELRPLSPDVFGNQELELVLRFERGENGAVTAFRIDAGRVRNLRSVRR